MRKTVITLSAVLIPAFAMAQSASEMGFTTPEGFPIFLVIGLLGLLAMGIFIGFIQKQQTKKDFEAKEKELGKMEDEISYLKLELEAKSISLDLLNKKLVTVLAAKEAIEKSSFARDRFLAAMSNEMRNPLNVITGLTHVLLKDNPKKEHIEQIRSLQFSANDLVVFINDILNFSNIEAGKLNLEDREFSPKDTVTDIEKRFLKRAVESKLMFHFFYDAKIPELLMGDDARLRQILTNLLTNTFKHTKEGHVKVYMSLFELKAREIMLKLVIEGTDGGVDRRTIEEMFKPHHTGNSVYEGFDGQQFSLAITKRLVELQNGKIDVDVEEGHKTTFSVLLPFKLVLDRLSTKKEAALPTYHNFSGTHILVVEDNKINQLVVAKMLKKLGMQVTLASQGFEALELVETNDFDLILMDIQMPEMDGYRATAEIRRHLVESKRDVPIIALTASAFLTEKEKAVLFGMNDHVGKPFSPGELTEKIYKCLKAYKNEEL
ncbi:MAG: response regulator [Bacteroidota bacterium]